MRIYDKKRTKTEVHKLPFALIGCNCDKDKTIKDANFVKLNHQDTAKLGQWSIKFSR